MYFAFSDQRSPLGHLPPPPPPHTAGLRWRLSNTEYNLNNNNDNINFKYSKYSSQVEDKRVKTNVYLQLKVLCVDLSHLKYARKRPLTIGIVKGNIFVLVYEVRLAYLSRGHYETSTPAGSRLQVVTWLRLSWYPAFPMGLSVHFVRVDSVCLAVYPSTCPCGYPSVIRPSIPPSIRTSDRPFGLVKSPSISVFLKGFAHHHPLMLSTFYQKAF